MALVIADRVKETTTTTGTGAISLAGAATNFRAFSSVMSNADTTYYAIIDDTNNAFEIGLGTYASSGNTITRTTVLTSSNSNNAVDFGSGSKDVFLTYPADKAVAKDASGDISVNISGQPDANLGDVLVNQLDIQAQGDLRLQDSLGGEYVALQAPSGVASSYTLTFPMSDGSADQVIKTNGSGQLSFVNNITSVVAGNGLTGGATSGDATVTVGAGAGVTVNSADVAVTMPVKAFVNFNGTGTVSIRNSAGVGSITDLGTGNYQVNWSSTLSSRPAVTASANNVTTNDNFGINVNNVNDTRAQLFCTEGGSSGVDKSELQVIAVAD
tara:strand:- start:596 stop:1576 length:981 start_codon:yes stop_codon:yes gene_type:complete